MKAWRDAANVWVNACVMCLTVTDLLVQKMIWFFLLIWLSLPFVTIAVCCVARRPARNCCMALWSVWSATTQRKRTIWRQTQWTQKVKSRLLSEVQCISLVEKNWGGQLIGKPRAVGFHLLSLEWEYSLPCFTSLLQLVWLPDVSFSDSFKAIWHKFSH